VKFGMIISVAAVLLVMRTCQASADEPAKTDHKQLRTSAAARHVLVIAHRGAHREAPENTLAAFRKAIELGCDCVEMDVRPTRDGALVIMHDATVDRTTNGAGKVEDLTLASIRDLDAGVKRGKAWAGEKVPTFDDALAVCHGKIKVYVDHKGGSPANVIAVIERHRMLKDVVIYGSVDRLREFKGLRPEVWVMCGHPGSPEKLTQLMKDLKPETLDGQLMTWSREEVHAAHQAGLQVWVDSLGLLDFSFGFRRALDLGVDAIQTDHPESLLKLLKDLGPGE
jgi:glycerophosphoryl diester phosphodiesterase